MDRVRVDPFCLFRLFIAACCVLFAAERSDACRGLVVYDRPTGNVSVVGITTRLNVIEIISEQEIFLPENAAPGIFLPPFDVISPTKLFTLKTQGFDRIDFGSVAPTGLSAAQLDFEIYGSAFCAATYFRLIVEDPAYPADFNGDLEYSIEDIAILQWAFGSRASRAEILDLNRDREINANDVIFWVREHVNSWIGDANLDGLFDTKDLVQVMSADRYESEFARADWSTGDWNSDLRFNSQDLVMALIDGGYEQGFRPPRAVPEPGGGALFALITFIVVERWSRHRKFSHARR